MITAFFKSIGATEYTQIYSHTLNTEAVGIVLTIQNQPHSNSALDVTFDNLSVKCERFIYPRTADSDKDGVIDEWDKCPDTLVGSVVYSDGCPHILGDFNNSSILGLEDCIGILQTICGLR